MKTRNNVQKAILRSAAVVVSLVLISFTVSAQDFWKRVLENSSFNEIALALAVNSNNTDAATEPTESLNAMYYETETESALTLEEWMTDNTVFNVPAAFEYTEASDDYLEVESWMLNENVFQPQNEKDSSLEVETWMVSDKVWKI
ncbi:MAG: hypothetical protein R3182_02250 [Draconibacterium sp.]|nr:hypothetical protein [Draconibacterium sp.]